MGVRLSVNINHTTAGILEKRAALQKSTVTEQIRRAVEVYELMEEAHDNGQHIVLESRDKRGRVIARTELKWLEQSPAK